MCSGLNVWLLALQPGFVGWSHLRISSPVMPSPGCTPSPPPITLPAAAGQDKVTLGPPQSQGRRRAAGELPQLASPGPWGTLLCRRPGAEGGTQSAARGPGPGHGHSQASRAWLWSPAPVAARRCAASGPAALHGVAPGGLGTPGPPRCPRATPDTPAAGARSPARSQKEAGDLRAQWAPSAAPGWRERDAPRAELLCPARASPQEGQLQTVQTWILELSLHPDGAGEPSAWAGGLPHWDLQTLVFPSN